MWSGGELVADWLKHVCCYMQAVLETIRDLMNTACVVPDWLHDTFLGYGDADSAHYSQMANQITALDFKDTFLSLDHLKASFPQHSIEVSGQHTYCVVIPCNIGKTLKKHSHNHC